MTDKRNLQKIAISFKSLQGLSVLEQISDIVTLTQSVKQSNINFPTTAHEII